MALATRVPGRLLIDGPVWLVKRCPYCRRKHVHIAPVTLLELALPAPCGEDRAYRVREVVAP